MTYEFCRWRVSTCSKLLWPASLATLALLSGCTALDLLMTRQLSYDTRTVLPPGQVLQVNSYGQLTKTGQQIEDFRCASSPMFCSGNGVVRDCRCPEVL